MSAPTVLVTGCSSGFGRAMVPAFLDAGWTVVATLRDPEQCQDLRAQPGRLHWLALDVTDPRARSAALDFVAEKLGGALDCLVNNAGYSLSGALEELDEAELRAQLETNFFAAALLSRALLPALRRARGRIIQVSSLCGFMGLPLMSAYCASKHALEGLSEALHYELRPHGVQVALVEPGGHRTRFLANGRFGAQVGARDSAYAPQTEGFRALQQRLASGEGVPPERVARAVVRLCARRRMPLRLRVGRDAALAHALLRALPERWSSALLAARYGALLGRRAAP